MSSTLRGITLRKLGDLLIDPKVIRKGEVAPSPPHNPGQRNLRSDVARAPQLRHEKAPFSEEKGAL
ncbi:MAG: hypothetical protein ACJAVK_000044 [Akkermansiaceae bacterium]|jgi:hypothetical protein